MMDDGRRGQNSPLTGYHIPWLVQNELRLKELADEVDSKRGTVNGVYAY